VGCWIPGTPYITHPGISLVCITWTYGLRGGVLLLQDRTCRFIRIIQRFSWRYHDIMCQAQYTSLVYGTWHCMFSWGSKVQPPRLYITVFARKKSVCARPIQANQEVKSVSGFSSIVLHFLAWRDLMSELFLFGFSHGAVRGIYQPLGVETAKQKKPRHKSTGWSAKTSCISPTSLITYKVKSSRKSSRACLAYEQ
jgi:hypothetical protein